MVEIKDLYKKYGKFTALNNLNLTIEKGELFGFVGPNGAGKTTVMKMISGLLAADSGEITVAEIDAIRDAAHLKEKIDGRLIKKRRYLIPLDDSHTIELDIFEGDLAPLQLAEVEFATEEEANSFVPPAWFGEDVTFSTKYHNSTLSRLP